MSPIDREMIRRKLERITANLRLLEPLRNLNLEEYRADVYRRKAAERLLQETVEAAVDINAHLLVEGGHSAPDDLFKSFIQLGETGMLEREFASAIAPSAGLRNRLVHQYDEIDDTIVLGAITTAIEQYARYVAAIEAYVSRA